MSDLARATAATLDHLTRRGVAFAVVGGLAVSVHVEPRFTRDVDLCVVVETDAEAEDLVRALRQEGYEVAALVEQEASGRLAAARLCTPDGCVVDLLFASSGVEREIVAEARELELFEGVRTKVATVPGLIALKVLAREDGSRPQDRVDLLALLRTASSSDLRRARDLLALIEERGFARSRDLAHLLDSALAELRD